MFNFSLKNLCFKETLLKGVPSLPIEPLTKEEDVMTIVKSERSFLQPGNKYERHNISFESNSRIFKKQLHN